MAVEKWLHLINETWLSNFKIFALSFAVLEVSEGSSSHNSGKRSQSDVMTGSSKSISTGLVSGK